MKKRLAVFISGRGSNLNIFLKNKHKFESLLVMSNKADAYGLVRAKEHAVPSLLLPKDICWKTVQCQLEDNNIDMIFLAGFLKILPGEFVVQWQGRIFNLHPSLLPKYKGLKSIQRAFEDQHDIGVSIHHVTPEVDGGEIDFQEIAVTAQETSLLSLEKAQEKTHTCEHQLVQRWIEKWA